MSTQWIVTACRLRKVREACFEFLDRWALARLTNDPRPLDRMASDVRQRADIAAADSGDLNWVFLRRGQNLDD